MSLQTEGIPSDVCGHLTLRSRIRATQETFGLLCLPTQSARSLGASTGAELAQGGLIEVVRETPFAVQASGGSCHSESERPSPTSLSRERRPSARTGQESRPSRDAGSVGDIGALDFGFGFLGRLRLGAVGPVLSVDLVELL
jgi:hypothetical protein